MSDPADYFEARVEEILHRIGNKMKADIKTRLRDHDKIASPNSTPNLITSINYNVKKEGDAWILEVGTNKEYLRYIELGRLPGKLPNIKAIETWVRHKMYRHKTFLKVDDYKNQSAKQKATQIKQASWAIAVSMKKKGVKAFPVLKFVFEQNMAFIEKEVASLMGGR